jgi:hypothetical protein
MSTRSSLKQKIIFLYVLKDLELEKKYKKMVVQNDLLSVLPGRTAQGRIV